MPDRPATPLEKLQAARLQSYELGKQYDENLWRSVINTGLRDQGRGDLALEENVANAETFEASPERARLLRLDDIEAKQELDAFSAAIAAERGSAADLSVTNRLQAGQINDQQKQIAQLQEQVGQLIALVKGGMVEAPQSPTPAPASLQAAAAMATQGLTREAVRLELAGATKNQIAEWARVHDFTLPEKWAVVTKTTMLDHVLGQVPSGE